MARRRSRPRVSLKHRPPNAPPLFLGRERELSWLEAALGRAPVAVVVGPGGIGKTSLVLRALADRFRAQLQRTVYFGVRPGEPTDQLRYDLVKVLAECGGEDVDPNDLAGDPEGLVETAIDLAETARLWVVIDDAHHADADEMGELLTQLATYARDSRYLVTSRMEPRAPALGGQVLPIGAMSEAELTQLARALSPAGPDPTIHQAVAAASGSPWLLSQYVASGRAGLELSRERLLDGLDGDVDPFLRVLSLLRAPIALSLLSGCTQVPGDDTIAAIERRGLLVRTAAGVRLHDVVAGPLYAGSAPDDGLREHVASHLEASDDPVAVVEAARLLRDAGAMAALGALLDRRAAELFAEGQAPRLWSVIGDLRDPRVVGHQIRCAAELGNPTALGALSRPNDPGPDDRLAWAHATYARGDVATAQALAGELRVAHAADRPEMAAEAALLRARCLLHDARYELAIQELESMSAPDPILAFRRDALFARCHAAAGSRGVDATLAELRRRSETAEEGLEAIVDLAHSLHELGRREGADELLDALLSTPRGGRASLLVARKALLLRARLRYEAGDVVAVAELVEALRPYVRSTSLLRPFVAELDAARRAAVGDLAGLLQRLGVAEHEAAGIDRRLAARLATLRETLAGDLGEAPSADPAPADRTSSTPEETALLVLRARRGLRHGVSLPPSLPDDAALPCRIQRLLLEADVALLRGDPMQAVEHTRAAAHEAGRAAHLPLEVVALESCCDATLVAGVADAHDAAVRTLVDRARALHSARGRLCAELAGRPDDPSVLERVASYPDVSPVAARRARALLGGGPPLDAVDRLVVDTVRSRHPTLRVRSAGPADGVWQPGWGIDARAHVVWLPEGRTVDLSSKGLQWRLLTELVRRGSATKEELVVGVWEERQYHPGRHDPRLHMSIRKLREVLEDDPSSPVRLVTTDSGYRVGGVVRVIEAAQ